MVPEGLHDDTVSFKPYDPKLLVNLVIVFRTSQREEGIAVGVIISDRKMEAEQVISTPPVLSSRLIMLS